MGRGIFGDEKSLFINKNPPNLPTSRPPHFPTSQPPVPPNLPTSGPSPQIKF
ncbi:hypothetical protein L8106_23296 [Lyngbya sp. PCC 8106]|nr:hypothetical protein L8106_23296 [Lyngbya sp. PCC 8106]